MATVPTPTTPPPGKLSGQVEPGRIIITSVLSSVGVLPQESHWRGKVHSTGAWVSDGTIEVVASSENGDHCQEWVRVVGGTYAFYVTWVEIDGQQASHPMAWEAYGQTQADRQRLETEILPLYRCMRQTGWKMLWRNSYLFNGRRTYKPRDVLYASAWPYHLDPHYLSHHYGAGPYPK